jgi:hypothetical protein
MRNDHFAVVVRVSQGLIQVRLVQHLPEPIYHVPISPLFIENHPLDCQLMGSRGELDGMRGR